MKLCFEASATLFHTHCLHTHTLSTHTHTHMLTTKPQAFLGTSAPTLLLTCTPHTRGYLARYI